MQPHEITQADFIAQAEAIELGNHGPMWKVVFGNDHVLTAAETADDAKRQAHYAYCNNAIFFNDPENVGLCTDDELPNMPTDEVLKPYPDLLMWKIEMPCLATNAATAGLSDSGAAASI